MSHNEGNGPDEDRDMPEIGDADLRQMGMTSRTFTSRSARCSAGSDNVGIARAVHFGARVLILDEPTAAPGVKQSGVVLECTAAAGDAGTSSSSTTDRTGSGTTGSSF